jgi:ribosomal protein S24E
MELKIINKKEDPLLSRTKVEAEVTFDKSTPSIVEIKAKLSKDLGKDEKLIVVKGIHTKYGLKKATNLSYIYENEESLKRIEIVNKSKKKKGKSEEKPEAKAEEKPKEAKEEKKEEAKPEAKKEDKAKQEEKPKEAKVEENKK